MTATMLTKEYGSVSPWIGVGAYSVAAATGLMRVANNKHWLSDVLTGAGVGILATEAGYWITDLIFKNKGLSVSYLDTQDEGEANASFLSLYLGVNLPLSDYDIDETNEFRTSTGSTAGLEGAWFPCRQDSALSRRFHLRHRHVFVLQGQFLLRNETFPGLQHPPAPQQIF